MATSATGGETSRRRIRLPAAAGLAVVIAAACVMVVRQPVTAPWWVYADADATYSSSALNIITGHHTKYLDHPGLPEQELLAVTFGAISLAHGGPNDAFAKGEMLHLDRARPVFRGYAIAFFVGGAMLAFFLISSLLGHWSWGVAGGLLWLSLPELPDSIQIRPDTLVAGLSLLAGFLVARALERRSPARFALAAAVIGFAMMVKLAAVALLVPLLIGSVAGYPGAAWPVTLRDEIRRWLSRHRKGAPIGVSVWVVFAVVLNARAPLAATRRWKDLVALCAVALVYLVARRVLKRLDPNSRTLRFADFYAVLALGLGVGVLATVGLLVGDGLQALSSIASTLEGKNVNAGISAFSEPTAIFTRFPLLECELVFGLGAVGAFVGLRRGDLQPALWFSGAAAAAVMASARGLGEVRYFAIPYVLSIPPALWLFRSRRAFAASLLPWVLVAAVVVPTFLHSHDDAAAATRAEHQAAAASRLADRLLGPGQAAIVPDGFPSADDRWYTLVQVFSALQPSYPYRLIDDVATELSTVRSHHLRLRYYISEFVPRNRKPFRLRLALGTYEATPLPGSFDPQTGVGALELLSGPGT